MSLTLPYLNMSVRVTVGKVRFNHVTSVAIEETVRELGNKATIEIPRNLQKLAGKPVLEYVSVGDPVTIELGYNGRLYTEFTGVLAIIDAEMPLVLHCDDAFWALKQNRFVKAYKSVTLKALLEDIMAGYEIDCPGVNLGKFQIDNASTFEVLKKIQQDYGLFSRISGKKITLGYAFDWTPTEGRWVIQRQKSVKSSRLTWRRKSDWKTRVLIKYWEGKKLKTYIVGDPSQGATIEKVGVIAPGISDAKTKGEAVYKKIVYDGFTGSITSFGIPRIHAGDAIDYHDALELGKDGVYLVDKVAIRWGNGGFSREANLAHRLDKID